VAYVKSCQDEYPVLAEDLLALVVTKSFGGQNKQR
jgi:hypothetical protein